jgi:predicted enzyme related to lactoylglutathione lyase
MTSDPAAARRFYGGVVGWKTKAFDQDPSYQVWTTGGRSMGGLMAQRIEGGAGPKPQWFNYIGTPDVDATVKQAAELGGNMMRPAWDIPKVGRIAFLNDPQGAPFAVMTPFPTEGHLPDPADLGSFSWHELLSTNSQAAWDFYSKLFDWQKTDAMDMGKLGTYQMFGQEGKTYGGMFTKPTPPPGPSFWLAYANVRDSKRAAETIKKLGGTLMNGPMQVPGGGWIVTGVDPQGAAFSVFSKPTAAASKPAPAKKTVRLKSRPTKQPAESRVASSGKARAKAAAKKAQPGSKHGTRKTGARKRRKKS